MTVGRFNNPFDNVRVRVTEGESEVIESHTPEFANEIRIMP